MGGVIEFQPGLRFSAGDSDEWGGFEPFVDETVVAKFMALTPRRVLEMARKKLIPAHPIGGGERKTWRFRLSEIDAHFHLHNHTQGAATIRMAVPATQQRRKVG